jgi:hypothetical protein
MVRVVADPAKLTVVAVVLIKLNVACVVVMSPPLTARSPTSVKLPAPVSVAARVVPPYHLKKLEVLGTLFHKVEDSIPIA